MRGFPFPHTLLGENPAPGQRNKHPSSVAAPTELGAGRAARGDRVPLRTLCLRPAGGAAPAGSPLSRACSSRAACAHPRGAWAHPGGPWLLAEGWAPCLLRTVSWRGGLSVLQMVRRQKQAAGALNEGVIRRLSPQ